MEGEREGWRESTNQFVKHFSKTGIDFGLKVTVRKSPSHQIRQPSTNNQQGAARGL